MRVLLLIAVLLSSLTTLSPGSVGQQSSAPPKPAPQQKSLPASVLDVELKSARGVPFKLSDYSDKVLVVNLWATWCSPCIRETPALVKLQRQFWSQGVRFVGLTEEDPEDSAEQVHEWVRNFRIQYKIGWVTEDFNKTLQQGGRDVLPQTFVVSRTGRIVRHFVGFNPTVTPRLVKEAIEEALMERQDINHASSHDR